MKNLSKILFSLIILVALFFISCDNNDDPDFLDEITITYRVTNTVEGRRVNIEYTPDKGTDVELKSVGLPWSESFTTRRDIGDVFVLTVKDRDGDGIMNASILVNDVLVEGETDDGLIVLVWRRKL
jgi:hypothetical protein